MEKNNISSVPLLNSSNYYVWSLKLKSFLTIRRLVDVIFNEEPADLKEQEKTEWNFKNADAISYIQLSLSDDYSLQFADENNAKELWNKIKKTFTGKIEDQKIDAGNEIKNIEMKNEENVNDYIARVRGLKTKCNTLGLDISERELVFYTVRGLKGKFSKVREILKTQREKEMDEILEILREEENTMLKQNGSHDFRKEEAFHVKNKNKGNLKVCFICKRNNHIAKNCFYRNKNNSTSPIMDERTVPVNKNKIKFKNSYNGPKNNEKRRNSEYFALASTQRTVTSDSENQDDVWILDSGSSSHMCNNLKYFCSINRENGYIQLAGKNSTLNSDGVGTVKTKTFIDNSENILMINDVIYAPDLKSNLISVTKLLDKGFKIESDCNNDILVLSENNKIVLKAMKINNRLEIILKPYNNESSNFSHCNLVNESGLYEIWHKRLCHLNPQYMSKMQDIIGINFKDFDISNCESCDISKVTRKNHPKVNFDQSNSILELIHIDLAGPINVDSLGNSRYFLVLVDDFSGMYFTYFLKHKYDVFEVFTVFKERYENLKNKRIKRVRSDNGLEFVNNELDRFLEKSGIIHEKTVPYNPESNGKSERAIRVLVERARTLLYESKLPLKFWAEAISCSTHVSNVTPRKQKQKLPLEIWTGREPKLTYLRTFGCVAYYHIPKQFRSKFDVPAKRGIFVGYSRERRAYRIYDIDKNIVIEERSVKFDETIKGSDFLINKNKSETYLWNIGDLTQFNEAENETEINSREEHDTDYSPSVFSPGEMIERNQNSRNSEIISDCPSQLRRSERIKNKLSANLALTGASADGNNLIPKNYEEIKNKDCKKWEHAMQKEIDSMNKHNVFELVERPKNEKIVKSKWIYSIKKSNDEEIYKARLVAAGFNQVKNVDYSESYSPVVNIESFRLLIALAAKLNLSVKFFDVKTAYLYSDIEETVYMEIPPGYEKQFGKNKVCKLNRSIYGLPQSGRNWHIKLKHELKRIGLTPLASDNCVFTYQDKTNFLAICVYVDDLAIFSNNPKLCEEKINNLQEIFELNETTKHSKFLGMEILQNADGISLSQTQYIESLMNKYGMKNCKKSNTPIVKGEDRCFAPTDNLVNQTEYQEIIGELLYLANRTRPDLAFVTSYLSQFNKRPEKRHYTLAKKVLKYLNGSKNKVLFYDRKFGFVNCSADASWGNGEKGKSFSGCVVMLGNSLVTWKSRKQKCVGLSTCEAELLATADTARELTWTLNMLYELNSMKFVNKPVIIYSDSQAAIDWLNSGKSSNKTRHVNLKFHFVKDLVDEKTVKVMYNSTNEMIADFLTKAVTKDKLLFCLEKICLI